MVERRLDCEDCRQLTVVGLHDTGPSSYPGQAPGDSTWRKTPRVKRNRTRVWGRNSSVGRVLGSLSCLMQRLGFDPPVRRFFPVEEMFSFGDNMGSDPIPPPPPPPPPPPLLPPPKTLWDGSINRGLVCTHMHSIARTQKIPIFTS